MNGLLSDWRAIAGAFVVSMMGVTGAAQAEELQLEPEGGEAVATDDDGLASLDLDDSIDGESLPLAQRYAPPPPRRRMRPYRPHWHYRIVPPPIFAPGWFGLYFLGSPPPPSRDGRAEPVQRPDFRHVNDYSLSLTAGGYYGDYEQGASYTDPGFRLALRYRNSPVVGAELGVGVFGTNLRLDEQGTEARSDVPIQLSALLHLFPRAPIQPYLMFGGTANLRTYQTFDGNDLGDAYSEVRVGPHLGIGLEVLIGDSLGVTVDARRVFYTLVDRRVEDQTRERDAIVTGGLNVYF